MTKITPTFPQQRVHISPLGFTNCTDSDWAWGKNYMLTDGSGSAYMEHCDGTASPVGSGTDNQLAYYKGANSMNKPYVMLIKMDQPAFFNYKADLATYGAGKTRLDAWKNRYVSLFNANNLKWMLDMEETMYGEGYTIGNVTAGKFQSRTPGYDSSWYAPPAGYAKSYETALGPAFDFIEQQCGPNFQGYHQEYISANALNWLYNRTNYWVEVKDYTGWRRTTSLSDEDCLTGTDANGNTITQTIDQRFQLVDEIAIEMTQAKFVPDMINWLTTRNAKHPNVKISINVDSVCHNVDYNGNDYSGTDTQGWWAPAGLTINGSRCQAERAYATQLHEYITERFGPFDAVTLCVLGTIYPFGGGGLPTYKWYLDWIEHLYLTSPIQRVSMPVTWS